MLKIGIITFHRACNYGAFLQSYALEHTINSIDGVSAALIDYRSREIEKRNALTFSLKRSGNLVKGAAKCMLDLHDNMKRNSVFEVARRKYFVFEETNVTREALQELSKHYHALITGSDQVWNPDIIKGDQTYLLDFVQAPAKKYAYAASLGKSVLSEEDRRYFGSMLSDYRRIAVRESDVVDELQALLQDIPVTSTIDPVFLSTASFWRSFSVYHERRPYVLFFMMGESKSALAAMRAAKQYTADKKLDLVFLSDNERWYKYRDLTHFGAASPEEFVGLIDHAQCVFTNSFHATAMSLILHSPVFVETNVLRSNRIKQLLQLVGLERRGLKSGVFSDDVTSIDWDDVDMNLRPYIEESKAYIDDIVSDIGQ